MSKHTRERYNNTAAKKGEKPDGHVEDKRHQFFNSEFHNGVIGVVVAPGGDADPAAAGTSRSKVDPVIGGRIERSNDK